VQCKQRRPLWANSRHVQGNRLCPPKAVAADLNTLARASTVGGIVRPTDEIRPPLDFAQHLPAYPATIAYVSLTALASSSNGAMHSGKLDCLSLDIALAVIRYKKWVGAMKTTIIAALIAILSIFLTGDEAAAQSGYPDRTVRMVVGYPPAGPVDIIARIMSDKLSEIWSQPVVVENVSGAAGNIAGDRVAKATPDGYTLLVATNAQLAVNPSLYNKMTYDPAKDLMPISQAVYSPNILVVPNDVPARNVQELVAYARSHIGEKLTFASAGVGTTQHLAGELFKAMANIDIQHVPYRGAAPVITDLLGGRITMYFGAISPLIPLVREGKVRALAVTSAERFGASPNLPTMIEAGFPGFVSILSIGLMAPVGTPPAIIEKIHKDTIKILALPDVREKLSDIGMELIGNSPAEFADAIKTETPQWAKVIKDAAIKPGN